ncbi:MAG: glucose-6-phosphate isomerase, partial [Myxococcota bacterium]|nr:glucose-6-phosphate isomerase [Myxococcota bacterium]
GLYAERIGITAYHQPGVVAGKRGARATLAALTRIRQALDETPRTAEALAAAAQCSPDVAWRVLIHLSATGRATVVHGERPSRDRFLGC